MREIRFSWWHPGRTCRILFGDGVTFSDLWVEEVQAVVDELTFADMDEGYRLPEPFVDRFPDDMTWLVEYHPNRPGQTLKTYMDTVGDAGERIVWDVCYNGACVQLSEDEATEFVRQWRRFLRKPIHGECEKVEWAKEGF